MKFFLMQGYFFVVLQELECSRGLLPPDVMAQPLQCILFSPEVTNRLNAHPIAKPTA